MKVNYYKILFYTWLLIIFLLAVIPVKTASNFNLNSKNVRIDYFEHFLVFAIAGFLNILKEEDYYRKNSIATIFKWFFILLIFSVLFEMIQIFIPLRTLNVKDIIYNVLGLFVGTSFTLLYIFLKKFLIDNKKIKLI